MAHGTNFEATRPDVVTRASMQRSKSILRSSLVGVTCVGGPMETGNVGIHFKLETKCLPFLVPQQALQ